MSKYRLEDGSIVNTSKAQAHWEEDTRWDGSNHISKATGSQWVHQTLYRSAKGRYYVETVSQWQGSLPGAELVSAEDAARWLLDNGHELPDDLAEYESAIEE